MIVLVIGFLFFLLMTVVNLNYHQIAIAHLKYARSTNLDGLIKKRIEEVNGLETSLGINGLITSMLLIALLLSSIDWSQLIKG